MSQSGPGTAKFPEGKSKEFPPRSPSEITQQGANTPANQRAPPATAAPVPQHAPTSSTTNNNVAPHFVPPPMPRPYRLVLGDLTRAVTRLHPSVFATHQHGRGITVPQHNEATSAQSADQIYQSLERANLPRVCVAQEGWELVLWFLGLENMTPEILHRICHWIPTLPREFLSNTEGPAIKIRPPMDTDGRVMPSSPRYRTYHTHLRQAFETARASRPTPRNMISTQQTPQFGNTTASNLRPSPQVQLPAQQHYHQVGSTHARMGVRPSSQLPNTRQQSQAPTSCGNEVNQKSRVGPGRTQSNFLTRGTDSGPDSPMSPSAAQPTEVQYSPWAERSPSSPSEHESDSESILGTESDSEATIDADSDGGFEAPNDAEAATGADLDKASVRQHRSNNGPGPLRALPPLEVEQAAMNPSAVNTHRTPGFLRTGPSSLLPAGVTARAQPLSGNDHTAVQYQTSGRHDEGMLNPLLRSPTVQQHPNPMSSVVLPHDAAAIRRDQTLHLSTNPPIQFWPMQQPPSSPASLLQPHGAVATQRTLITPDFKRIHGMTGKTTPAARKRIKLVHERGLCEVCQRPPTQNQPPHPPRQHPETVEVDDGADDEIFVIENPGQLPVTTSPPKRNHSQAFGSEQPNDTQVGPIQKSVQPHTDFPSLDAGPAPFEPPPQDLNTGDTENPTNRLMELLNAIRAHTPPSNKAVLDSANEVETIIQGNQREYDIRQQEKYEQALAENGDPALRAAEKRLNELEKRWAKNNKQQVEYFKKHIPSILKDVQAAQQTVRNAHRKFEQKVPVEATADVGPGWIEVESDRFAFEEILECQAGEDEGGMVKIVILAKAREKTAEENVKEEAGDDDADDDDADDDTASEGDSDHEGARDEEDPRHDSAGPNKGSQGDARQGGARQGGARQGGARQGGARQGGAREGDARQGDAHRGGARGVRTRTEQRRRFERFQTLSLELITTPQLATPRTLREYLEMINSNVRDGDEFDEHDAVEILSELATMGEIGWDEDEQIVSQPDSAMDSDD